MQSLTGPFLHQHQQIRLLLAGTLKAIICQRLLARSDMPGRIPALEIMVNHGAIKECIMDPDKAVDIPDLMEAGNVQYGMQTFDQSLVSLYQNKIVSYEDASSRCSRPALFDRFCQGFFPNIDDGE